MAQRMLAAVAAVILVMGATMARVSAHASLVRCSIKNGQVFKVGHTPSMVKAFFAEELTPSQSWITVYEGQADHGQVEKQHWAVNYQNPKEIDLTLPKLIKEKYYLIWHNQSSVDQHFAAGIVYFQVK